MTKEEIEAEIERLKYENEQLDIHQYALKIQMNSAYGAISAPTNPLGDTDLANAITMSGSMSIRQVNEIAINFFKKKEKAAILKKKEEAQKYLYGERRP